MSGSCPKCGVARRRLHREHITPRWQGGSDDPSNIQYICANCHEDKTYAESQTSEYRTMMANTSPNELRRMYGYLGSAMLTPEEKAQRAAQMRAGIKRQPKVLLVPDYKKRGLTLEEYREEARQKFIERMKTAMTPEINREGGRKGGNISGPKTKNFLQLTHEQRVENGRKGAEKSHLAQWGSDQFDMNSLPAPRNNNKKQRDA